MHCRDYRYLALFYPFVALLAAYGFCWIFRKLGKRWFILIVLLLFVWFAFVGFRFYWLNEARVPVPAAESFFSFIDGVPRGEVWVSNPIVAAYTDAKLFKAYYPIYDEGVSKRFVDYVRDNRNNLSYVLLDNCGGGLMCADDDLVFRQNTEALFAFVD